VNGTRVLEVSWAELIWAAITVGKWRDDLFAHGRYSAFEAISRAALHWANLREDHARHFVRSDAYDDLDPSEKSGVSYALGMTSAKVFAARQLSTPWLLHVDRYRTPFGVTLRPGRSRPDLIGPRDPNRLRNWIVVEAKGRTNNLDDGTITALRRQKQTILTIGGRAPVLSVGSATHFTNDVLEVEVVDPEARGRRSIELFGDAFGDAKRRFAAAYYQPFIDLLEEDGAETRRDLVRQRLALADLTIGMPAHRFDAIRAFIGGEQEDIDLGFEAQGAVTDSARSFAGADAVVVELGESWSDTLMRLEPRERMAQ